MADLRTAEPSPFRIRSHQRGSSHVTAESQPATARRPFRRSRKHRLIGGVCGGLAEWLGWRPSLVRILFVLIGALPILPGILVYVVLWLVVPQEN